MKYVKIAEAIATMAHAKQYRRNGKTSYIIHPLMVAKRFCDDKHKAIAWLHDVFEMSDIGNAILLQFPNDVLEAVVALTKNEGEDYFDYIKRVKKNRYAKTVKVQDIKHNYKTATVEQKAKYDNALTMLLEKKSETICSR